MSFLRFTPKELAELEDLRAKEDAEDAMIAAELNAELKAAIEAEEKEEAALIEKQKKDLLEAEIIAAKDKADALKEKDKQALELIEESLVICNKHIDDLKLDIEKKFNKYHAKQCEFTPAHRTIDKILKIDNRIALAKADITHDTNAYKVFDGIKTTLEKAKNSPHPSSEIENTFTKLKKASESTKLKNYSKRHTNFIDKMIDKFWRWLKGQEEPKKSVKTIKTNFQLFCDNFKKSVIYVSEEKSSSLSAKTTYDDTLMHDAQLSEKRIHS